MLADVEAPPRRLRRLPGGLQRVAAISASLVGTQALTSILGLIFWTLAARTFPVADVGVAGAAVSMMLLLASLGTMGLGTLLISRLPTTDPGQRRLLVRTSLTAAGAGGALLGVVVPLAAVQLFHADNLRPLAASPLGLLGFALGTAAMSVVLVLDQAVLTIGSGSLQLERNILASVVKIVALIALSAAHVHGGMTIYLAWTVGTLVSLPLVSLRTRGGRKLQSSRRLVDVRLLRGLARAAVSHHALNTTLQAALQILPIMVTVMLSAQDNAYFNSAIMVSGFVFALPFAIAISLFASAGGDERQVMARMRVTIPFSLAVSAAAYLALFPLAGVVLEIFGKSYASEGVEILRILTLAGVAFVIKDHYVALRRVQDRTTEAVSILAVFLVVELAAAAVGAVVGGAIGLCVAWCAVLWLEAVVFGVGLFRSARALRSLDAHDESPARADDTATAELAPTIELAAALVLAGESTTAAAPTAGVEVTDRVPDDESTNITTATDLEHSAEPEVVSLAKPAITPHQLSRAAETAETAETAHTPRTAETAGRPQAPRRRWDGPVVGLMAVGVLLLSLAANGSRVHSPNGFYSALWIAGLVLIVLPAAARILHRNTGPAERLTLAVAVPVMLEVSRLVLYPTFFANHDELIHTNTLRSIDETSHLFSMNPLLPTSAFYPGLEVVTDAIHRLTGLSAFVSSWVVLVLARVVIALAIVGLVRLVTRSSRAAAIASMLYVCNPQQLFFNSQYSYQTLALPLAVFTAYMFLARHRGSRLSLVLPLLGMAAVTFAHHLTAMLLVLAFAVWWLVELSLGRRSAVAADRRLRPTDAAGARDRLRAVRVLRRQDLSGLLVMWVSGAVMSVVAALNPGSPVISYLLAIAQGSEAGIQGLTDGDKAKPVFSDSAGSGPAPWEQVLLIASVAIVGLSLLIALVQAWRQFRTRRIPALVLSLLALLYPIIPAGHLTVATSEVGDRASGFVFIGLAACIGGWLAARRWRPIWSRLTAVVLTVVFLGSVVLGSGPTLRQLPGPYLISADARSIDGANLAAAEWLAAEIPPDTRVYADRVSGLLAASVGGQFTVRHLSTNIDASRLLLDPKFTPDDIALIKKADLSYLIVDTRLAQGLPHLDVYIETGEFDGRTRTAPVPEAALQKFSTVPGVSKVYDNGSLQIYNLEGLRDAD